MLSFVFVGCPFTVLFYFDNSVLDADPYFSSEDEKMIEIMDVERSIDCIRLLTLKHRILNASKEWMSSFYASGGYTVVYFFIMYFCTICCFTRL